MTSLAVRPSAGNVSVTLSLPLVIVPVLSKHIVSTLAKASMAGNARTKTRLTARLRAETASATFVNKTSPSGIIPIMAALVVKIARL